MFVNTSPAVRHMAKNYKVFLNLHYSLSIFKIDLSKINGTGPKNRITKEDIIKYIETNKLNSQSFNNNTLQNIESKLVNKEIKLTGIKKSMFKTMTESNNIPHLYFNDLIDVTLFWKLLIFIILYLYIVN